MYELVVNDKVQRENINSINYFRDDKLVQFQFDKILCRCRCWISGKVQESIPAQLKMF